MFRLWRPQRHPNVVRAPKLKLKLVRLEREIGATADRIRERKAHRKRRSVIARVFKKVTTAIAYIGRLIIIAVRPTPKVYEHASQFKGTVVSKGDAGGTVNAAGSTHRTHPQPGDLQHRTASSHSKRAVASKGEAVGKAIAPGSFLISICIGMVLICGMLIAILFRQIRDMEREIALWKQHVAMVEAHLDRDEKNAQQTIGKEPKLLGTAPPHIPFTLSNDDMKAVRASIRVLPSNPGAQQKIHVGDEITGTIALPVPESLVSQIPKLRGAKFLVDQNSAIVIIGQGSNRADAVIEPQ
jgi:hypothetical protein